MMPIRTHARSAAVSALLALALALYLASVWWDWLTWLRGWLTYPEGWSWPYVRRAPPLARYLSPLLVCGLGAAALRVFQRRVERLQGFTLSLALAMLVILGYLWQLGLLGLKADTPNQLLLSRISDENFTGYFTAAQRVHEFRTFFQDWRSVLQLCGHCPTHPIGSTMYFWLLFQGVIWLPAEAQESIAGVLRSTLGFRVPLGPNQIIAGLAGGHGMLLLAALTMVPLFALARRMAGSRGAMLVASLGVVLPGLVLMSPELDQAYALLSSSTLALAVTGLEAQRARDRLIAGGITGLLLALGLFFTFGLVVWIGVLLALACAYGLGATLSSIDAEPGSLPSRIKNAAMWSGALLAGLAVPYLVLGPTGYNVLEVATAALGTHRAFEADRPGSSVWLVFGPLDFLQFLGLPVALTALACLGWRLRSRDAVSGEGLVQAWIRSMNVYAWMFWLLIVVMFGSGNLKAETSRTLIFFMPLALAALALAAGRTAHLNALRLGMLLVAQLLICLVIGSRWFTP